MQLAEALTPTSPRLSALLDGAFLMPVEDVFLHLGSRHRGDRPGTRHGQVGEEIEIVGIVTPRRPPAPAWKCSALLDQRSGWRQHRPAARHQAEEVGAAKRCALAHQAHTQFGLRCMC